MGRLLSRDRQQVSCYVRRTAPGTLMPILPSPSPAVAPSGRQARPSLARALAATLAALLTVGTTVVSGPTAGATVTQDATGTTTTTTTTIASDGETPARATGDSFDSANIDLDTWVLSDPSGGARVSVTDGVLEAVLAADSEAWLPEDRAVRLIQEVDDITSDLELELVAPPSVPYQSIGFFMGDAQDVWQRIDLVAGPDGLRLFAASFNKGFPRVRINELVPDDSRFLAVRRIGHAQTILVSPDGETWTTVGTFVNPVPVGRVGIGFGSRQPGEEPIRVEAFRVEGAEPEGPGPDAQAPLVQDVTTERTESGLLVRWVTDETAISGVQWGRTAEYEFGSLPSEGRIEHSVLLPDLDAGVTYHFQIIATDALGNTFIGEDRTSHFVPAGRPFIDTWYGDEMVFGPLGTPQRFLNVVGNVGDEDGIASLTYALDGGEPIELDLGPDERRLVAPGDFNAEVPVDGLAPGRHEVLLRAEDNTGSVSTRTVGLEWAPLDTPPTLPIETDWATAESVTDEVQIVDGKWTIEDGMLRNLDVGYDRVFTIGDRSLTDYEVTFPFVIHKVDKEGFNTISGTPAMGFTLGWTGHYAVGNETPFWGYWPSTGTASFVWDSVDEASLKVAGNEDAPQAFTPGVRLPLETPLRLRVRVERIDEGSRISMRAWADGSDEPDGWAISVVEDDGPEAGSIAVVAHHVDVSFGDIVVQEKR